MSDDPTKEALKRQIDICDWQLIVPHYAKGTVVVVDQCLDFLEVAIAIVNDDTANVKNWMTEEKILNANDDHLLVWNQIPEKQFRMVVVLPYVLIQEVLDS